MNDMIVIATNPIKKQARLSASNSDHHHHQSAGKPDCRPATVIVITTTPITMWHRGTSVPSGKRQDTSKEKKERWWIKESAGERMEKRK